MIVFYINNFVSCHFCYHQGVFFYSLCYLVHVYCIMKMSNGYKIIVWLSIVLLWWLSVHFIVKSSFWQFKQIGILTMYHLIKYIVRSYKIYWHPLIPAETLSVFFSMNFRKPQQYRSIQYRRLSYFNNQFRHRKSAVRNRKKGFQILLVTHLSKFKTSEAKKPSLCFEFDMIQTVQRGRQQDEFHRSCLSGWMRSLSHLFSTQTLVPSFPPSIVQTEMQACDECQASDRLRFSHLAVHDRNM